MSLFAGCGGLDLGFRDLAFDLVYACDVDADAVATFAHNVDERVTRRDVNDPAFLDDLHRIGAADVVLGGFPCQGFSKAGPKRAEDERNSLYLRMRDAVHALRPRVFLAENVDGIQQNFGGRYVDLVRDGFRFPDLSYRVDVRILDASAYGVPQHRRRAFFVGVRSDLARAFTWPEPTHAHRERNGEFSVAARARPDLPPPPTVGDALRDLVGASGVSDHEVTGSWPAKYAHVFRAIGPGQKLCNVRHAATSVHTWQIPEVFGDVTPRERLVLETLSRHRRLKRYGDLPNGNPLPVDEIGRLSGLSATGPEIGSLLGKGYLKPVNDGYDLKGALFCSGLFKRPRWDEPAPTVLTNFHNPRYFLHPELDRPFTLRECARLQGFPDDFQFRAAGISLVAGYRLVGNAVAPPVGRAFAEAIRALLEGSLN